MLPALRIGSTDRVFVLTGAGICVQRNNRSPSARSSAARARCAGRTVYVGPERPDNARVFDECRLGKAGEVLPTLFEVT
ncbi:MAG: hypothetical protein ABSE49_21130 [Polyangiaceae bacterium]|jgi:NAD-dependent SIR2 family protein deacetylase